MSLSWLEPGSWREVTDAGLLKLRRSLVAASNCSWKPIEDVENLKSGIKQDEYIFVMPRTWVAAGLSLIIIFFLLS